MFYTVEGEAKSPDSQARAANTVHATYMVAVRAIMEKLFSQSQIHG